MDRPRRNWLFRRENLPLHERKVNAHDKVSARGKLIRALIGSTLIESKLSKCPFNWCLPQSSVDIGRSPSITVTLNGYKLLSPPCTPPNSFTWQKRSLITTATSITYYVVMSFFESPLFFPSCLSSLKGPAVSRNWNTKLTFRELTLLWQRMMMSQRWDLLAVVMAVIAVAPTGKASLV